MITDVINKAIALKASSADTKTRDNLTYLFPLYTNRKLKPKLLKCFEPGLASIRQYKSNIERINSRILWMSVNIAAA